MYKHSGWLKVIFDYNNKKNVTVRLRDISCIIVYTNGDSVNLFLVVISTVFIIENIKS